MSRSARDEAALARRLKVLAEVEASVDTPSRVETAVMARWEADHAPRTWSRTAGLVRGAATTAAAAIVIAALVWQRAAQPTPATSVNVATSQPRYTTVAVVGEPFQANEPVRVVRMRVPRSVVTDLGMTPSTPSDTVDIDLLVGEDGVARGVRMSM